MNKPTVLVTGATGFIAQHVINKLLSRGYTVIGTGRTESKNSIVVNNFKNKYPKGELSFSVVPDIGVDDAFDAVLIDHPEIKYVIHMASPVAFGTGKPLAKAFLDPAVAGVLNILNGIKKYGPQVSNVVMTSSFVAVMQRGEAYVNEVHTNKLWNPITWEEVDNEFDAYTASKKFAELAARDFIKNEKPNFKFATVNPPLVFGPQMFDDSVGQILNFSNQMLNGIAHIDVNATGPQKEYPMASIDVRDVAEFHILPFENELLANEREVIVASPVIAQRILNILNDNFPELKGRIAVGDYGSADKLEDELCSKYDISGTINKISGGYEFIPLEKTVVDVYKQYLAKHAFA